MASFLANENDSIPEAIKDSVDQLSGLNEFIRVDLCSSSSHIKMPFETTLSSSLHHLDVEFIN